MRKDKNEIKKIKESVLNLIDKKTLTKKVNVMGKNIYKTEGSGLLFDISYASLNSRNEYFFGVEKEQLEKLYAENRNSYQIFICENKEQVFFIPISLLVEIFKDVTATQHNGFSQYKPIITIRNGDCIMRCFGRYSINNYLNRYDLLNKNVKPDSKIHKKAKVVARETNLGNKEFHKLIISMLKKIGEWENYEVLTEQKPKELDDFPYNPDCLWYKNGDLYIAIEVCYRGNLEKDKDCLKLLKKLGARKVILVSDLSKLERVRKLFMYNGEIKSWTEFWSFDRILQMYNEGEKFFSNFKKFQKYSYNENIREYL